MALLAMIGRVLVRSRAPFVYEVLDIRDLMLGHSVPSRVARAFERLVLRHAVVLVVSSPAFVSNYFEPVQRYRGSTKLVENKLAEAPTRNIPQPRPPGEAPWVIEWTGSLRCERSLQILCEASDQLDGRLLVRLHGVPSRIGQNDLDRMIAQHPNVIYLGPYRSPDELPDVYKGAHLNWCIDLSNWPANSAWLLPNRLYEGSYFAVPALGLSGTCTGDVIESRRIGFLLPTPTSSALVEFIETVDRRAYERVVGRLTTAPVDEFVDKDEVSELLEEVHKSRGLVR